MAPPSRRLALRGRTFAFHGVARDRREQWTRVLEARGATVLLRTPGPTTATTQAHEVVVLTDWWVDTVPVSSTRPRGNVVYVSEFWLRESLKLGECLDPDAHPFFVPPAALNTNRAPLLLAYPMDYDDNVLPGVVQDSAISAPRVRLPCSPLNLYEDVVPLWPYIVAYLREPPTTTAELTAVLQRITGDSRHRLNCLQVAIDELLSDADRDAFFQIVLPTMTQLVLDLPFLFRNSVALLPPIEAVPSSPSSIASLRDASVHLSRAQLLPLLSAMFLAVFPAQQHVPDVEFPWFNMENMFSAPRSMLDFVQLKAHKIRTILEYFLRVVPRFLQSRDALENEIVTFSRIALLVPPLANPRNTRVDSAQLSSTLLESLTVVPQASGALSDVRIETNALIEDLEAHLQIDFANKYAGGGVMNGGAVQEEIRFIVSPELMVACLLFARLEPHESFVVHGTERFSSYTGYGSSFRFGGSVQDATPFETVVTNPSVQQPQRRRKCVVVGIDAISYGGNNVNRQYSRRSIVRELMKALVGFAYMDPDTTAWPIATGNWGCGVFRGDPELKFLIQWLAASLAGRPLVYVIFEQTSDLEEKMTLVLRECERVRQVQPHTHSRTLALWVLEFLLELERELVDRATRGGGATSRTEGRRGRGRDERSIGSTSRRSTVETVLDRAVTFLRGKEVAHATTSSTGSTNEMTVLTTETSAPLVPAVTTTENLPPPRQPQQSTSSVAHTTATTPRHRTSASANGQSGGPQLKQPKLSAFWK